jgi:hypothetical protein
VVGRNTNAALEGVILLPKDDFIIFADATLNTIHGKLVPDLEFHAIEGFLVEEGFPAGHNNFVIQTRLAAALGSLALEGVNFELGRGGRFLVEHRLHLEFQRTRGNGREVEPLLRRVFFQFDDVLVAFFRDHQ